MAQTFRGYVAGIEFTATEVANARARGTSVENLRNVANSKINDAITAVKELQAICGDGNRQVLDDVIQALG